LEADHRLIHCEVTPGDVELLEEALTLVVKGRSLLDDGLFLIARHRRDNVKVTMELNEAIPGHELSDVAVAIGSFPVMVQFG
jgi:hypothetical protein